MISLTLTEEIIETYGKLDYAIFYDKFETLNEEETYAMTLIGHPNKLGVTERRLISLQGNE